MVVIGWEERAGYGRRRRRSRYQKVQARALVLLRGRGPVSPARYRDRRWIESETERRVVHVRARVYVRRLPERERGDETWWDWGWGHDEDEEEGGRYANGEDE